ncbi:hypothetical protein SCAR479_02415 [Seiridium cardinale]|uniref:Uncharacterized protein n=1 Tax=Seiridium cardinale TaxID=138064 RepID=A0ABR2X5W7_9PEZI
MADVVRFPSPERPGDQPGGKPAALLVEATQLPPANLE